MLNAAGLLNAIALARDGLDDSDESSLGPVCELAAAIVRAALERCHEPAGMDDAHAVLEALAEQLEHGDAVDLGAIVEIAEAMTEETT